MAKTYSRGPAEKVWSRIYLRELREARGLSQEKLADKAGVSYSMISLIESHKSAGSPDTLEALAKALGLELGDLFTEPQKGKVLLRVYVDEAERRGVQAFLAAMRK
jgi:transcriptional regulator with XRE-family HTH domain